MDRTLFSPSMIDTFRACKRAYELAFANYSQGSGGNRAVPSICRSFVRKGLAEINRGRISTNNEIQTFIGKEWPVDMMEGSGADADSVARAFLFSYKALSGYAKHPYKPAGAEVVAVALKARSRVPNVKVYLEDTFDLILWYPQRKHLEIVEYQLRSQKMFSTAWPTVSALVKRFLCERLKVRWPFESVSITTIKISGKSPRSEQPIAPSTLTATNIIIDEAIYQAHFEEIVKDLEVMKCPTDRPPHKRDETCHYCDSLSHRSVKEGLGKEFFLSLSA